MKKKNLNALKHGGFVEALILPNEDPEDFKKLHDTLKNEWYPDGPSEEDKVLSVAMGHWRKRRFRRFFQDQVNDVEWLAALRRRTIDRESDRLANFLEEQESGTLGPITEDDLSAKLGTKWAGLIKKFVPRSKFETDASWLEEIAKFIFEAPSKKVPDISEALSDAACCEREMGFEERIDAKIAKDLKELRQIKTMKAMGLGKRRVTEPIDDLKVVKSPSIVAGPSASLSAPATSSESPLNQDANEE